MHGSLQHQSATKSEAPCHWSGDLGPPLYPDPFVFLRLEIEQERLDRRQRLQCEARRARIVWRAYCCAAGRPDPYPPRPAPTFGKPVARFPEPMPLDAFVRAYQSTKFGFQLPALPEGRPWVKRLPNGRIRVNVPGATHARLRDLTAACWGIERPLLGWPELGILRRLPERRVVGFVSTAPTSLGGKPVMYRWTRDRGPQREQPPLGTVLVGFAVPAWMVGWAWLFRDRYVDADPPYATVRPAQEVGLRLEEERTLVWCTESRDSLIWCESGFVRPRSTFVPYKRMKPPGRVGPDIPDDQAWKWEAVEAGALSDKKEFTDNIDRVPEPNEWATASDEIEDKDEARHDDWYWLNFFHAPDDGDIAGAAFDAGTRLPWQRPASTPAHKVPKDERAAAASQRRKAWKAFKDGRLILWFVGRAALAFKDGHPPVLLRHGIEVPRPPRPRGPQRKGERLSAEQRREIALFGMQAREAHGYRQAVRLMVDHFQISQAMAKRILGCEITRQK
jgi:hypothetical protein